MGILPVSLDVVTKGVAVNILVRNPSPATGRVRGS